MHVGAPAASAPSSPVLASPLRVAASSHPHRYTHRTAILTSSPPRARRRVVVAVSPLHGWGWHLHGVAPTRRRALLRTCSPLAHLFQTGMSCRAVCMFVPHRAAHAARRRVVYLVAHLVVVHLGKHFVVHLLCTRHPRTRELGSCTGNAPVLHLLPASRCRRRVVVASSRRRRVAPSLPLAKTMGSSPRRPIVASSSSPSSPRHRCTASPRYRYTVSPTLSAAVSPAILASLLASTLSSPRSPVLTHPHPAWVRSEDPNQEAPAARACSKHPVRASVGHPLLASVRAGARKAPGSDAPQ